VEAYAKYKGSAFKFAEVKGWHVIVTGPGLVNELSKAPDDELSISESLKTFLQLPYTMGGTLNDNSYHVPVMRAFFTRNLDRIYPSLRDEVVAAFNEHLIQKDDEWMAFAAFSSTTQMVARNANRVLVGLPLCRDPEYLALVRGFAGNVMKCAAIINLFPVVLQPIVGRLTSTVEQSVACGAKHLGPIIQERLRLQEEHGGNWSDKPVDYLQSLLDAATPDELSVPALTRRILSINFAGIFGASMAFTTALYRLAASPDEYLHPLREEVDAVIAEHGWTKAATQHMHKVDSFIRESLRVSGGGLILMTRRAVKDFTFSDGTFVPAGTYVSASGSATHHDEELYPNADVFDPWRFANMRTEGSDAGATHVLASTSVDYFVFGHGRHACAGRAFAATEMKTMLAHIVSSYDVKMEQEGVFPASTKIGTASLPSTTARVMFRKRQA